VDADELFARDGEHAERVGISEVVLAGERQPLQVVDRDHVARVDVGKALSVERNSLLDVADQSSHPLGLKRAELLARHGPRFRIEDHLPILCPPATFRGRSC
jgi:hypothetical protein